MIKCRGQTNSSIFLAVVRHSPRNTFSTWAHWNSDRKRIATSICIWIRRIHMHAYAIERCEKRFRYRHMHFLSSMQMNTVYKYPIKPYDKELIGFKVFNTDFFHYASQFFFALIRFYVDFMGRIFTPYIFIDEIRRRIGLSGTITSAFCVWFKCGNLMICTFYHRKCISKAAFIPIMLNQHISPSNAVWALERWTQSLECLNCQFIPHTMGHFEMRQQKKYIYICLYKQTASYNIIDCW